MTQQNLVLVNNTKFHRNQPSSLGAVSCQEETKRWFGTFYRNVPKTVQITEIIAHTCFGYISFFY
jgi:hypothetical protein